MPLTVAVIKFLFSIPLINLTSKDILLKTFVRLCFEIWMEQVINVFDKISLLKDTE